MVEQYCWQYVSKDEVYLGGQGFSTLSTCPLNLQVLLNGTDFFNNHLWNWEKKKIKDKENEKTLFYDLARRTECLISVTFCYTVTANNGLTQRQENYVHLTLCGLYLRRPLVCSLRNVTMLLKYEKPHLKFYWITAFMSIQT